MAEIYFISPNYLRDNGVINANVDSRLLSPFIMRSQRIRIEPILGTDLMNRVKTSIMVEGNNITGDTKTLLENYIKPCLREWVVYDALPFLNYKLTNKSVAKKSSDNSEPSDLDELKYLRNNIRDVAEFLSQRVTDFLRANPNKYPEYLSNSDIDDIYPNSTSYFSGLYLPGNIGYCDFLDRDWE